MGPKRPERLRRMSGGLTPAAPLSSRETVKTVSMDGGPATPRSSGVLMRAGYFHPGIRIQTLPSFRLPVCLCGMSYKTLTVTSEAFERLQKLKAPGESFSDVILRELPESWATCGNVLDGLRKMHVPRPDRKLMAAVLRGRGGRSPRK